MPEEKMPLTHGISVTAWCRFAALGMDEVALGGSVGLPPQRQSELNQLNSLYVSTIRDQPDEGEESEGELEFEMLQRFLAQTSHGQSHGHDNGGVLLDYELLLYQYYYCYGYDYYYLNEYCLRTALLFLFRFVILHSLPEILLPLPQFEQQRCSVSLLCTFIPEAAAPVHAHGPNYVEKMNCSALS